MKKIIFLFILFGTVIHAQDPTPQKKGYRIHSIAVSQRFGGVSSYQTMFDIAGIISGGSIDGFTAHYNYANYMTSLEFFTQRRKGRSQYTPMVAIRLGYNTSKSYSLSGFHWGFLFGGSQYIFDFRSKETGLGWSMLANGGLTIDFPNISAIKSLTFPVNIGGEVDFKAIYNFHKYIGVTFGFNIGYSFALDGSIIKVIGDLTGPGIPPTYILADHNLVWSFNVGVIF
ncbi:MAG: hypothetical protein ACRC0X_04970 [Brevinema sp.]